MRPPKRRQRNRAHQRERRKRRKSELLASVPPQVTITYAADGQNWHDGSGWHYIWNEYPEEGSCGAFNTLRNCVYHARQAVAAGT